jgi:hypothetical protein
MKICGGAVSFFTLALVAVELACASSASAISITNRDERQHKVTIVEGTVEQSHTLAPLGVLEGLCLQSCVVRLNDSADDEYELEGTEVVSIEEGFLYYDGPEAAPATPPPADAKPADPAPAPKKP